MAAPSTPTNPYITTGNGQVFLGWDLMATATSYNVQRSTDGITYSSIATPAVPYYLDTSGTIGTLYWYKVAAVNGDGTSAYTTPEKAVPVETGEMCLAQIRLNAQEEADMVNNAFVSTAEWNRFINNSYFELYDLLVTVYEDQFQEPAPAQFTTDGSQSYSVPDGSTAFVNSFTGASYTPAPLFKLCGVDAQLGTGPNGWVNLDKFNFQERNAYAFNTAIATPYGIVKPAYRLMGNKLYLIPAPQSGLAIRLWFVPRLTMLLRDQDRSVAGVSGWMEYVIVDAAIKAKNKEESDCSVLMARKQALKERIEAAAANRDQGTPDRIADTRAANNPWGFPGPIGGL